MTQDTTKKCSECGAEIEYLCEFPNTNGPGVVCLPCYERQMDGVEITAEDVTRAFVASVNV